MALVLDDNKLNVKVIKRLLEKYGFKVVTVSSGQECIYKIKSEEHFDIIFMDQVILTPTLFLLIVILQSGKKIILTLN
jgi:CheY-like chemotaxis protein